jgi:NAD-dependent SIR2 family protein deacetylase
MLPKSYDHFVTEHAQAVARAAEAIAGADALLVGAGAGMGVDSGLPDFRGDEGFWKAYPPMAKLGIRFVEMANPRWFRSDPELAWGFYGHRLHLYRDTVPHAGYELLRRWGDGKPGGLFAYTSNVDGQFQKAGYGDRVVECHGSLHHLQCSGGCAGGIWSAEGVEVRVDEASFRASAPLPSCPHCGGVARPNVLMFGDWGWIGDRTERQERRFAAWLESLRGKRLVVVECGAGTAVPTVRWQCERVASALGGTLIRINPREPKGPHGTVSLSTAALESLQAIDTAL